MLCRVPVVTVVEQNTSEDTGGRIACKTGFGTKLAGVVWDMLLMGRGVCGEIPLGDAWESGLTRVV